jgi:nitrogen fixation/metabolism regulation signal transduction histidine kinase
MDYKGFNAGIIVRVVILVILAIFTAFAIIKNEWFFTPLVSGILLVTAVIELVRHLNYYSRNLNNFLIAIKQSGFNTTFPEKDKGNALFHAFNEITKAFHDLSIEKETNYQFLKTLTDSIEAGLIAYDKQGNINWINPEARMIIDKPGISTFTQLKKYQPVLVHEIESLRTGQKKLIQLPNGNGLMDISLQINQISIGGEDLFIALLQNIHREMEMKEVEAWQKLTRVMRHEIMNSMTPIVNLTEAVNQVLASKNGLDSKDSDFGDIKESLLAVENRSKGLIKFVNAYKDFSQTPELHISEFSFKGMMDKIISLLETDLSSKRIKLEMDIRPSTIKINADEELLEQVIINLIKNSLEAFGEEGGMIRIFCRKDVEGCLIKVSDNGSGISSDMIERIFVPFFTTKTKGSGIGLSLSRQIIHQHGGRINVVSSSNTGTTFVIEL